VTFGHYGRVLVTGSRTTDLITVPPKLHWPSFRPMRGPHIMIAELIWLVPLMWRYPLCHSKSGADQSKLGSPARRDDTNPDHPN
jgi:hypothetical protein